MLWENVPISLWDGVWLYAFFGRGLGRVVKQPGVGFGELEGDDGAGVALPLRSAGGVFVILVAVAGPAVFLFAVIIIVAMHGDVMLDGFADGAQDAVFIETGLDAVLDIDEAADGEADFGDGFADADGAIEVFEFVGMVEQAADEDAQNDDFFVEDAGAAALEVIQLAGAQAAGVEVGGGEIKLADELDEGDFAGVGVAGLAAALALGADFRGHGLSFGVGIPCAYSIEYMF